MLKSNNQFNLEFFSFSFSGNSVFFKFFSSSFLLCVLILTITVNAQSITVNSTNYKQTIDMIGGDMERSSFAIQKAQNKDEIINWGFKDVNFNYCRVQFDKHQELIEGTKNWAFYTKQIATMKQIKAINPNIKFFATMRTDYDGYGDKLEEVLEINITLYMYQYLSCAPLSCR